MTCTHCGFEHDASAGGICTSTGRSSRDRGLIGEVVSDKYRVIRLLGLGGMGEVYECEHVGTGRRVCMKRLLPEFRIQKDVMARFEREARVAAAIEHENVIEVMDVGTGVDGSPYFVMPRLIGESLGELLKQGGALPVDRACRIMAQVLDALVAAHARRIVHRDLKPDNIFLVSRPGATDLVKLLDFGISKIDDGNSGLTKTGALIGTPAYMSPEQARGGRDLDHRADLWAAGVILFEMLDGKPAYQSETYHGMLIKIVTEPPPRLVERRPDLPEGLLTVVQKAMAQNIERRYRTASEFLAAVRPWTSWRPGDAVPAGFVLSDHQVSASYAVVGTAAAGPAATGPLGSMGPMGMTDPQRAIALDATMARGASPDIAMSQSPSMSAAGELREVRPTSTLRSNRHGSSTLVAIGAGLALVGIGAAWFAISRSHQAHSTTATAPATTPATTPAGQPPIAAAQPSVAAAQPSVAAAQPSASATPAAQPAAPAAQPTIAPQTAVPQPAAANTVQLVLTASPPQSVLFVDGARVDGNPFTARFPKDGTAHQVMAVADGYQPSRSIVVFDGDRRLDLKLDKARGGRSSAPSLSALPHLSNIPSTSPATGPAPTSTSTPTAAPAPVVREVRETHTTPHRPKAKPLITDYP